MNSDKAKHESSLPKLWLVLSVLALFVVFNVMRVLQGGTLKLGLDAFLGLEFAHNIPEALAALWGVVLLSVLVWACGEILILHARSTGGMDRTAALPLLRT